MTKYENECCNCSTESYPCIGNDCKMRAVPHYFCDKCEEEIDDILYELDGREFCRECVLDEIPQKVVS